MLNYEKIKVGNIIYLIETGPTILCMEILEKSFKDGEDRVKLKSPDLTFEIDFNDIKNNSYVDKDEAEANAIKHLFLEVNKLISTLSENELHDYYDLELKVEKYKELFPELYI